MDQAGLVGYARRLGVRISSGTQSSCMAALLASPERPARWDGHGLSDRAGFGARRNGDSARRDRRRRSIGARRWGRFGDSLSRRPAASASVVPRRHGSRGGRRCGRRRCGGAGSRRPCRKLDHRVYHQREQYHPDCAGRHQSRRTAVPRRRGLRWLRFVAVTAISCGRGGLGVVIGIVGVGRHERRC